MPEQETVITGDRLSTLTPPSQPQRGSWSRGREVADIVAMLEQDAIARQAATFLASVCIGLIGEYTHETERIQQFVRTALAGMRGDWSATLRWLMRAPVVGYAVSEKLWKQGRVEGRQAWIIDALLPVRPESVAFDGLHMDGSTGQLDEVVQWGQYGGGIHIPGAKCVHWAYDDLGDGYGTPLGRAMLTLYKGKCEAWDHWGVGLQRMGQPYIYERIPNTRVKASNTAEEKPLVEQIAEDWGHAEGGSVILRPVTIEWAEHGLPSAEVLATPGFDEAFQRYVKHVDAAYFLALGIPALSQMEAEYGTRAQSVVHMDAARFCALPLAMQFAEECLVRDLVVPLVDVNFGEQDDYGSFPATIPLNEEWLAGLLQSLASAGVLGMMLDFRVYERIQALLPEILPEVEEGDYYTEQAPSQPVQPPLPAEPPADEEQPEELQR